jgi:hypothetical protein
MIVMPARPPRVLPSQGSCQILTQIMSFAFPRDWAEGRK